MPKLTFLGHSAFLVEGKNHSLVIDPFLSGNPAAKVKPADIKVDYVLVTHGHGDHLGDAVEIAKRNNATVVAMNEIAIYCQKRGVKAHGMNIGGGYNFPFGRLKLTLAHHSSCAPDGTYMGDAAGMLITIDGKMLYHAGDTALFYDMKLIGEMNTIDLALLPIGDNFTMGVDDAVKAAEFLQANMYIPMHYKTFEVIDVDPQEFIDKLSQSGLQGKIVGVGESYQY